MISEFPLFVFTTLGGIAAGAYVARAIEPLKVGRTASWAFPLFALALLAVSGFALLGHLGQPLRVLNAFSNPAAGITQEGIVTVLFGVAVVADFALCLKRGDSPRWLVTVAAALGVVLAAVMGLAYASLPGTPAWAGIATVPFFILGDLALGAGCYILFRRDAFSVKAYSVYFMVISVSAAACACALGAHFAALGYEIAPFVFCAIAVVVGAVLAAFAGKNGNKAFAYAAFACVVVGVVVVRYAFYTGSII